MDHSAGLDVSVKETSICVVDDTGRIVREAKVASGQQRILARDRLSTQCGQMAKAVSLLGRILSASLTR